MESITEARWQWATGCGWTRTAGDGWTHAGVSLRKSQRRCRSVIQIDASMASETCWVGGGRWGRPLQGVAGGCRLLGVVGPA